ncbi:helix-turn-helix domain-containing protein [Streptosporangium carneum]|uniref:Transcriptional regulator n=1 Tax=Streptosporangium carneum TaxID=47481 RepID=A0A9W6I6E9_9ACTN|nr:helix-turn-helix transcriptional regulator [Streptosporangium carneum]GLK12977.1 transcriptional regulator [Streptosporangium carneum]
MTAPTSFDPNISPRAQFGTELRKHRSMARMSQKTLATLTGWSISQISMLENGNRGPTPELARSMDAALGLDGTLSNLWAMLDNVSNQLPTWYRSWLEIEREADTLRTWQPLIVPGLLQTEGYARAVLTSEPGTTPEQIEEHTTARMERQNILRRTTPPMMWVLLDESVLDRPIGSPAVMAAQLSHLADVTQSLRIVVQVVPLSAYSAVGLLGAFVIATARGEPDTAYIDSAGISVRVTGRPEDVTSLAFRYDAIRAEALSQRESLILIKEKMRRWTTYDRN